MRRAIHKFAENAEQNRLKKANKQRLVYMHFENKISSMVNAFERFTIQKSLHQRFSQWKNKAIVASQAQ